MTPVHVAVGGLSGGETYLYRLVASTPAANQGGLSETEVLAFTAPAPPRVSASASDVSSTFARLDAQIDPSGAATSYHFEYDTRTYGEGEGPHGVSVPVPDVSIGAGGASGSSIESVAANLSGLTPGVTYHFRVVAENEIKEDGETTYGPQTTYGPDESFTTLSEATPDDRGYELVTPAEKEGGGDMFAEPEVNGTFYNRQDDGTPSVSGEGYLLESNSPFGEFPFAIEGAYVFRRVPAEDGWSYASLASRALGVQSFIGATVEPVGLSSVAVNDGLGARIGEGESLANLLGPPGAPDVCEGPVSVEQAVSLGCYILLHKDSVVFHNEADEAADTQVVGASQSMGHVVLESRTLAGEAPLCLGAGAVTHGNVLCEWAGVYENFGPTATPALRLVDVKPGSEQTPVSECGAGIGDRYVATGGNTGPAYRAVSADGSRVFFTAPDPNASDPKAAVDHDGCWNGEKTEEEGEGPVNAPQLYVRIGGSTTLKVSAAEKTVREAGGKPREYPAYFAGASEDGSRVFFATKTWVTQDHPTGHDLELYECQIVETESGPACILTRVSAGEEGQPGLAKGAGLVHVPEVAADGDAVYFEANGKLTLDAPVTGGLYRYDTQTGAINYISPGGQWEPSSPRPACAR